MKWLWLALAFFVSSVSAFSLDREAFTFTNYNLDIRIEPDQQRLEVRGKITGRNDSVSPQKNLTLQISSSLGWRSIQIAGKPVEFVSQPYRSDIDHTGALSEAIVTLPREISPHGSVTLDVGYEGTVLLDTTRLERIGVPKELAKHNDWDEIGASFTAVRGAGYVTWYPVSMESADLSDGNRVAETIGQWKSRQSDSSLKVELHYQRSSSDEPPTILCSGKETNQIYQEMGRAQLVAADCTFSPIGIAVPSFAIGNYGTLEQPDITVYYLPDHKPDAQNCALAAELSLPLVSGWFGPVREKTRLAELPDAQASPFESGDVLFAPLANKDSTKYELAAVHQLTHAAFPSSRPWIYEGLAHFAQAADVESKSGRQAALDFMNSHRALIGSAEKTSLRENDGDAAASESLVNTYNEEFYRSKAMYVWWMIRDMIGEKALKQALAHYSPDQDKEASYMPRLIEAHANRDMEWFFDDWVYRDHGLPDFRVDSVYPRKLVNGGYLVTVTVENLGDAGAEVPVTLRTDTEEISKRLEVHAKSKASIRIETVNTPREVVVNDGSVPESDMSNNSYKVVLSAN